MSAQPLADDHVDLTVDELAAAAGVPVRRIRFYAGKKLLPPPRLEGRTGLYDATHLARLRLIADLQDSGYTLAAIEQFLTALPDGADPDTVELYGTLLAPASSGPAVELTLQELQERVGMELSERQVERMREANLLEFDGDTRRVHMTPAQLEFALRMVAADAPLDVLIEAGDVVKRHARRLAEDLQDVFADGILAQYEDPTPEERQQLRALSTALRPLTLQAIVVAYQRALEEVVRERRG